MLEGANEALANNKTMQIPVRVIHKMPDKSSWSKNSFFYDGAIIALLS